MEIAEKGIREDIMIQEIIAFLGRRGEFFYISVFMLLMFFIFLISWLIEPRRLINGGLFTIFFISVFAWITVMINKSTSRGLQRAYNLLLLIVFFGIILILVFAWLFLFWNAYFVWKYESHTLPNLLTLFSGFIALIFSVIFILGPGRYLPHWLSALLASIPAIAIYLGLVLYNFLVNLLLYQIYPRHYKQDYLIVLGAGLINGDQVSKLLAARINRAIQFSNRQYQKGRKRPIIIMSGGQGPDEKVPEALAMAKFAQHRGVSPDHILIEDQSKNTYQNMLFSKQLATNDFGGPNFKATFFSNNYHIFRAALLAKEVGLKANGVGAFTRLYYLPNAIIREFAGVFVMHKRRHFVIMGVIVLFFILQAILAAAGIVKFNVI